MFLVVSVLAMNQMVLANFMATLFRNPYLAEGLENLLYKQDGLVLGICNGFQALIKLGLLPVVILKP